MHTLERADLLDPPEVECTRRVDTPAQAVEAIRRGLRGTAEA